ncbi:MAG: shikimate kinase, partial [Terrimicrobiaceae bacterium]
MLPNFVLIGFMGCGKSSVGRRLSGMTGHRFVDTDELIVQSESRTIPEIFSQSGEDYFRDVEQRSLEELVGVCGIILSTGGGLVLR